MTRETIVEAPTVEEALTAALDELGIAKDEAGYEVLAEPGKGFLGLSGKRVARVRAWVRGDEATAVPLSTPSLVAKQPPASEVPAAGYDEDGEEAEALPAELVAEQAEAPLSDDELDEIADAAVDTVRTVLAGFGIEATIDEYEGDEGEIILDIVGGDLAILIGRHGRTLDSLQTLVSAVTSRRIGKRYPVLVDVEGYRSRRRAKIEEIARGAADRAHRTGREVRLRPMSSYERRIVHVTLRENGRVATASEGEEPFRRVVVSPQ
jgi:spoIIIJ-associated protein